LPDPASGVDARLAVLAGRALEAAAGGLSGLLGTRVALATPSIRLMGLGAAVAAFGGEQTPVVAVQLSVGRDLTGQVLLLFDAVSAARLADLCVPGSADAGLRESVLAEVANVAGSGFVNHVADRLGLSVHISPPQVVADMAGAVLGSILPLAEAIPGRVLLIETRFVVAGQGVDGHFILAPDGPSLQRLLQVAGGGGAGHER
jgi:chemotaxis protein CheC